MQYVHSRKVIHRDLKLGNLFLTDKMQLKVGDFGLAAQVFYQGEKKRTVCGTPNYLAPEVLEAGGGHSYEVDHWSIGVILYTMLNGRPPFESQEVKQTYKKIRAGAFSFPEHIVIGSQAKDFIRRCLTVDISKRINLQEMLDHDFFTLIPIPKQIPVSTLVCPPAAAFLKQFALPARTSLVNNEMSPSPLGSNTVRQRRVLHHMQTAPMENVLRTVNKNQVSSPLARNGIEICSNNDNAHIMGSEKTGATPGQPAIVRQTSIGPAIISEFNPIDGQAAPDIDNKAAKDGNALHEVLRDNFLKTQMSLGSTNNLMVHNHQQLQDMKTNPGSPTKGMVSNHPGSSKTARQALNNNGMSVGKNQRVTSSASATSMPRLNN